MKLNKLFAAAAVAVLAIAAASCGGNKEGDQAEGQGNVVTLEEAEKTFASSLSKSDTTLLMDMSRAFMDSLKAGNQAAAVDMLYERDANGQPQPLSAEEREQLIKRYTMFPVKSWHMEYFDLSIPNINDMKFVYKMTDDPNKPGMAIMLNPVKVDGKWYLMLKQDDQPAKDAKNALSPDAAVQMPEEK